MHGIVHATKLRIRIEVTDLSNMVAIASAPTCKGYIPPLAHYIYDVNLLLIQITSNALTMFSMLKNGTRMDSFACTVKISGWRNTVIVNTASLQSIASSCLVDQNVSKISVL